MAPSSFSPQVLCLLGQFSKDSTRIVLNYGLGAQFDITALIPRANDSAHRMVLNLSLSLEHLPTSIELWINNREMGKVMC